MMKTTSLLLMLLMAPLVAAFPTIDYTGQPCSAKSPKVADLCKGEKTDIVLEGLPADRKVDSTWLVYAGESIEMLCCTPPKLQTGVGATLSQREITYNVSSRVLSLVRGNQTVNSNVTAANIVMSSNSSMCEFLTLSIKRATHNDDGTWSCSSYDGDTNKAQIHVMVADKYNPPLPFTTTTPSDGKTLNHKCQFQGGYSTEVLKGEWSIGLNRSAMVTVTGNGSYADPALTVTDLGTAASQLVCPVENNTYDQLAGGNYSRTWCSNLMTMQLRVALNDTLKKDVNVSIACTLKVGTRYAVTSDAVTRNLAGIPKTTTSSTSYAPALKGGHWTVALGFFLLQASLAVLAKEPRNTDSSRI